ncbi:MAG: hypothetical protein IH802_12985, partial [Nitrospinae bacterium]|nr:hypothetical protein [Nitrospinota bacterium]
ANARFMKETLENIRENASGKKLKREKTPIQTPAPKPIPKPVPGTPRKEGVHARTRKNN